MREADTSCSPCTVGAPFPPLTPSFYEQGKRFKEWSLVHILTADEATFSWSLAATFPLLLFRFFNLISTFMWPWLFGASLQHSWCFSSFSWGWKIDLVKILSLDPPILVSKKAYWSLLALKSLLSFNWACQKSLKWSCRGIRYGSSQENRKHSSHLK